MIAPLPWRDQADLNCLQMTLRVAEAVREIFAALPAPAPRSPRPADGTDGFALMTALIGQLRVGIAPLETTHPAPEALPSPAQDFA